MPGFCHAFSIQTVGRRLPHPSSIIRRFVASFQAQPIVSSESTHRYLADPVLLEIPREGLPLRRQCPQPNSVPLRYNRHCLSQASTKRCHSGGVENTTYHKTTMSHLVLESVVLLNRLLTEIAWCLPLCADKLRSSPLLFPISADMHLPSYISTDHI